MMAIHAQARRLGAHSANSIFLMKDLATPLPVAVAVSMARPMPLMSGAFMPKTRRNVSAIGKSVTTVAPNFGRSNADEATAGVVKAPFEGLIGRVGFTEKEAEEIGAVGNEN